MTSLKSFIKSVRAAKTVAAERTAIQKESAAIRTSFRDDRASQSTRRANIAKLLYLFTLGERTHFGQVECVKLLASPYFVDKRLGYLGTMLLLDENQEVLMLITNSLDNDLSHPNQYVVSLALCTMANIASVDMSRDLFGKIQKLVGSSNAYLRKKAVLCALRIVRKVPELEEMFVEHLKVLLLEQNNSVLLSACSLGIEMIDNNPDLVNDIESFLPQLLFALKTLATTYNTEYDVGGIPDPFLQTRLIRLLRAIGQDNPDLSEQMSDLLAAIVTNTDTTKNVGNAVLYEAVLAIFGIESDSALRVLGINVLGKFLVNKDNNTRYVALNTLLKVVSIEPIAVQRHRATIVDCFNDPDLSIRRRALELSYSLINEHNVRVMIKELLAFLQVCDLEFKTEMVSQIALAAERFAPNKRWHLDTLMRALKLAGSYVKENILSAFILQTIEAPDLQLYVVQSLYAGLVKDFSQSGLTTVSLWLVAEYSDQLLAGGNYEFDDQRIEVSEKLLVDLVIGVLDSPYATLVVQEYGVNALVKLSTRLHETAQLDRIRRALDSYQSALSTEIQQRALEYGVLIGESSLRKGVLTKMPAPEFGDDLEAQHAKAMSKALVKRKKRVPISTGQNANARKRNTDAVADLLDFGADAAPVPQTSNDLLADIFGGSAPAATPAAAPAASPASAEQVPGTSAFKDAAIELKFSDRNEGPGTVFIHAVFIAKQSVTDLALQVAVPKSQKLSLQPLSSSAIAPGSTAEQAIRVTGAQGSVPRLRLRVSYTCGGQQHMQQLDYSQFSSTL